MRTSALKMVRNSPTPQTGPDQSDRLEQSGPVGPEKPFPRPALTGFTPANDPFIGLVSGTAPDPTTEITPEPEPDFPVETDQEGDRLFKRLNLETASRDSGNRYLEVDILSGEPKIVVSNMDEADFIQFWAVDVYEAISGAFMLFRIDVSEIETEEEELEQARKAAKNLYRMAKRRPKMFGWMMNESTLEGADWMMCVGFFGGKIAAVIAGIKERRLEKKRKALEKALKEDINTPFLPSRDRSGPVIEGEAARA